MAERMTTKKAQTLVGCLGKALPQTSGHRAVLVEVIRPEYMPILIQAINDTVVYIATESGAGDNMVAIRIRPYTNRIRRAEPAPGVHIVGIGR